MLKRLNPYKHFLVLLISTSSLAVPCRAQDLLVRSEVYGIEDGLPHREVNALYQDSRGFIWVGSKGGLSRFDGYAFQNFSTATDSFLQNDVFRILEDAEGNFWLIKAGGKDFDIWNPGTRQRTTFRKRYGELPQLNTIPHTSLRFNPADSTILVPASNGSELLKFHPGKGISSLSFDKARHLDIISTGDIIWVIADSSRMMGLDPNGRKWRFDLSGNQPAYRNEETETFHARYLLKGWNYCWLADTTGILGQLPGNYVNPVLIPGASFPSIGEDLIIDQLKIYKLDGTLLHDLVPQRDKDRQLYARSILFDKAGNIWIGTDFGLTRVSIFRNYFKTYLSRPDFDSYNASTIRGILREGEKLLVSHETFGPFWVDLKTGKSQRLNHPKKYLGYNGIVKLRDGSYASGNSEGVFVFDKHGAFLFQKKTPGVVICLYEYRPGELWLGTSKGLVAFNIQSREISQPPFQSKLADALDTWIYQIAPLSEGRIALSTSKGLYLIDKSNGAVQRYAVSEAGAHFLPRGAILHCFEDADGSLWLGTDGVGLIHLQLSFPEDSKSNAGGDHPAARHHYRQHTRSTGFPDDVIYAVYPDRRGNLWLSSDNGIICFNKQTGGALTFLEEAGIPHREFNRISHFQDETGRLYFGGLNGIAAFHPDSLLALDEQGSAPMAVSSIFKLNGKTGQMEEITSEYLTNGGITMQPGDRSLTVEVALLNFRNVKATSYAWKLGGLDEDWSFSRHHSQRFDRLPYGDYHLMVKAMDANGIWSETVIDIPIRVVPPFYRRIWFYLLLALVTLACMGYLVRWRTRRLKAQADFLQQEVARRTRTIEQQAEELRSLEQLKSRFFANVSHELRTPLSLLVGPVEMMLKRSDGQEENRQLLGFVQRNVQHLLRLVNEILDLAKLESGKLEVQEQAVHFYSFLQPMVSQFSSKSNGEQVHWLFEYSAQLDLVVQLDTSKFEKIVHNYLSNALKHTPPGKSILLEVEEQAAHLLIKVQDEGPGIHPEDLPHVFDRFFQSRRPESWTEGGTGIGLSLCQELAGLLQGEVWAESDYGRGSAFYFRFPKKTVSALESSASAPAEEAAGQAIAAAKVLDTPAGRTAGWAGETILVVEDNVDLQAYIAIMLGAAYRVRQAVNGQEAWELLQGADLPDLVISDLMMPVMDGLQLLERMKGSDRLCHLPVIMLTARADVNARLQALRIGVDDYLTKPFVEEELQVRVRRLLENYRQRGELPEPAGLEAESPASIGVHDMEWLAQVEAVYIEHLADVSLGIAQVAYKVNLGERQFMRRLKRLTGLTPNLYLREIRLQKARDYLQQQRFATVKETAAAVGFSKTQYFSSLFQERFGVPPSHYLS